MSKRYPKAKWPLPTVVNPTGRKCLMIQVPDDPGHIAAFRGALLALQSAYNWDDDPGHTAREVALVWREIIDNSLEWGCDMQTLIAFDDLCGLQWSYDNGQTWQSASFADCAKYWSKQEIQDAITDGTVAPGGQPGPSNPPVPGSCNTWHVKLSANSKWLLPSPVSAGDTITVTEAHGGWNDGSIQWFCPEGTAFVLGACTGDIPAEAGDPIQSINHMRLIGAYGTATPSYFDAMAGTYTVPVGVSNEQAWLQANDGSLYDNTGDILFDVQLCVGACSPVFHNWASGLLPYRAADAAHGDWNPNSWLGGPPWYAVDEWGAHLVSGVLYGGQGSPGSGQSAVVLELDHYCSLTSVTFNWANTAGSAGIIGVVGHKSTGWGSVHSNGWGNYNTISFTAESVNKIEIVVYGSNSSVGLASNTIVLG